MKCVVVRYGLMASVGWWLMLPSIAAAATVIHLTQTACQFVEAEGVDRHYAALTVRQCRAINAESAAQRVGKALPLRVKAGEYIFRVENRDVPYVLGFWLRGAGIARLTLPSVSGGGIATGARRDYVISLKPGSYHYSCPLNPTPDYNLIVEAE